MRTNLFRFTAATVLAAGMALAQQSVPAPAGPESGTQAGTGQHRRGQGQWMERMATRLGLTDAQKEQAKAIFQSARESAKPAAEQLKQSRQALAEAVKAGKSDAEIDQLAANQAQALSQVIAIRTKAMAKVYALLTPEQRTKAEQMHEDMRNHLRQRFGNRG